MTDRIDASDGAHGTDFEHEVRRMLQRRAADVPDQRPESVVPSPTALRLANTGGRGGSDARGGADLDGPAAGPGVLDAPAPHPASLPGRARRAGVLVAIAAVVLAVAGIGVANWRDDSPQQLAVGGPAATGSSVLVPPEGDSFVLETVDSTNEQFGALAIEYGPADGDLTEGIAVMVSPGDVLPGQLVTADQSAVLADLGAVFVGPTVISWVDPAIGPEGAPMAVTVPWYGSGISLEQGLAVAAALSEDPTSELTSASLPAGWVVRSNSAVSGSEAERFQLRLNGPWQADLISFGLEVPFAAFLADWGEAGGLLPTAVERDVRGRSGLLVAWPVADETSSRPEALLWHENGATYMFEPTEPVDELDLIGLADRLVEVDLEEAQRRTGQDVEVSTPPSIPTTTTPIPPSMPTTTGVGPGGTESEAPDTTTTSFTTSMPAVSMTAPGPGDIQSATADESGPVANAILSVATGTFRDQDYEVGVVWSPSYGLCLGVDFDGAITEGGFPVECELEPGVGGGGSRHVSGGVLIFAFVDAATTEATFEFGGFTGAADVYRLDELPEFSFLVFEIDDVVPGDLSGVNLVGAMELRDQDGQLVAVG